MKCRRCKGTGEVPILLNPEEAPFEGLQWGERICPDCDGAGRAMDPIQRQELLMEHGPGYFE